MGIFATIVVFIILPVILVILLATAIRMNIIMLIEAVAIAIIIWTSILFLMFITHRFYYQADQFSAILLFLILPISGTILTARLTPKLLLWAIFSTLPALFCLIIALAISPSQPFKFVSILYAPPIILVICFIAGVLHLMFFPRLDEGRCASVNNDDGHQPFRIRTLIVVMAGTCGLGYWFTPPQINFPVTGTVIEAGSRKPIAGAYVLAIYERDNGKGQEVCIASKGVYTGVNGKYEFPITAFNYFSPRYIAAIKPRYFMSRASDGPAKPISVYSDPRAYFTNRNIVLTRQEVGLPVSVVADGSTRIGPCEDAPNAEDAQASTFFLRMEIEESIRLGVRTNAEIALCRQDFSINRQPKENCDRKKK